MPKATSGITNLYLYNKYVQDINDDPTANISDTETLRYIIDETNNLIGKKCARNFGSATYREWVETNGMSYIVLNNYPITMIKHCSLNGVDLMTITGTGFQNAIVQSNATSITLNSIATDGTETTTAFNYSTYANVNTMVTAIDLISGWDATVLSDRGSSLTQNIRPLDNGWALDDEVYLRGPYLGTNARIAYDSDAIVEFGANFLDDDYNVGRWVYIHYVAGYTLPVCDDQGGDLTTSGNVPEGLTMIANQIIKDVSDSIGEDQNMKTEKIGDYSYTRDGISSAIDRHWSDLNQYARKSV